MLELLTIEQLEQEIKMIDGKDFVFHDIHHATAIYLKRQNQRILKGDLHYE